MSNQELRWQKVLGGRPFNAVTYLTDHEMGRTTDTRLTSAWFGQNRTRKAKALKLATEYAEAA